MAGEPIGQPPQDGSGNRDSRGEAAEPGIDGHQLPRLLGHEPSIRPAMETLGHQLAPLGIENHGQVLDFAGDGGSDRGQCFHPQDLRPRRVGQDFGRRDPDPHPGERSGPDADRHQVQVGGSPANSAEQFPHTGANDWALRRLESKSISNNRL